MRLNEWFLKETQALAPQLSAFRRDFHTNAETGWLEMRTASKIARRLTELGYTVLVGREVCREEDRMGVPPEEVLREHAEWAKTHGADPEFLDQVKDGFTGVIGILHGAQDGPVYGMRFDIDALGVTESCENSHFPAREDFSSVNPGCMHACGHDGHAAIGLGVAEILMRHRDQWNGTVKLIFQPAEEGVRGAKSIVGAGHLDDIEILLGSHVAAMPEDETCDLIPGAGGSLATTKLDAVFHGQAAHAGGSPESGKNAMLAMATAILNLQAIPRHSGGATRINVGRAEAGTGRNVIPDYARLELEIRGETSELNDYMETYARRIVKAAAEMHDCTLDLQVMGAAGSLESSPELMQAIQKVAPACGLKVSKELRAVSHGSEDFAYMMNCVQAHGGQASFMQLTVPTAGPAHSPTFDFDERALVNGVRAFAGFLLFGGAR